jgi:transposase-like protein
MRFQPPFCPYPACSAHASRPFRFQRHGTFLRKCDGRLVQRFHCRECARTFSSQSFRLDYRLRRPRLHLDLWSLFVSKVTHRQAARMLACDRKTVLQRLDLLGRHCQRFHLARLRSARLLGTFQLDELETFEHSRRLQPLTVPVLIQRHSYFLVDLDVAPLPCRGGLRQADRQRKARREALHGKRRSGSRAAVERCLATLAGCLPGRALLESDAKPAYGACVRRAAAGRLAHRRHSGRGRRDYGHPLFPINHTLAMLRDGVSRLVRRTWAASKKALRLQRHLWIWACWRNYVRGITNRAPHVTPAMAAAVARRPLTKDEILAWRVSR